MKFFILPQITQILTDCFLRRISPTELTELTEANAIENILPQITQIFTDKLIFIPLIAINFYSIN